MNTHTNIIAAAAVAAALAFPTIASAQAVFYPSSYAWGQIGTTSIPGDARAQDLNHSRHQLPHRAEPHGQW